MSAPDASIDDEAPRIMVIDRQGRVTGVVELDDVLALCATALDDLAHRTIPPSERPAHGRPVGPRSRS